MRRTILWSLAAAAILAMAAGGAVPADAAKLIGGKKGTSADPSRTGYDLKVAKPAASEAHSVRGRRTTTVGGARLQGRTPARAKDSNKDKWIDIQSFSW
jgi:hypothetical protein